MKISELSNVMQETISTETKKVQENALQDNHMKRKS